MAKFQVQLAGEWKDYARDEDQILKRAYRAGFPHCKFALRGTIYEYNFRCMVQQNLTSGKARQIRAPHGWQQPAQPVNVPKGPAVFARVPRGGAGSSMLLDHPRVKGAKLNVAIPAAAKPGQLILVPLPDVAVATEVSVAAGVLPPAATTEAGKGKGRKPTALIGMVRESSNGVGGKVAAMMGGVRSKVGAVVGAVSPSRGNKNQQMQQKEESGGWSKGRKAAAGAGVAVAAGLAAGGAVAAATADGDAAADTAAAPVVDCPIYFEPYPPLPAEDVVPPMCPGAFGDSAGEVTVEEPPAAAADVPEDGGDAACEDAVECLEEADLYLCSPEDEADELILDPDFCGDATGDWGDEAAEDLGGCIIDFF